VDLKFAQEFTINVGKKKHTFEITADILTLLTEQKWGKRYFTANDQVQLIHKLVWYRCKCKPPTFILNPGLQTTSTKLMMLV
jgi:hypothetical protein